MTRPISRQAGAALAVSLILLLVMTIIGLTAMRQNVLEERMAGASMEHNSALQLTEAALRDAEVWLGSRVLWPEASNGAKPDVWLRRGPETLINSPVALWTDTNWANANFQAYGDQTGAQDLANIPTQPRYVIEEWTTPTDNEVEIEKREKGMGEFYYRITAHGQGPAGNARVTLQAHLPKVFK